ncbi:DUF3455 domain-containing protein [Mitsuaria sp. GD03876]|uniref:DUF3455 domain-containing protein n=1 Tax=Mitsuaria sp. GD03876 TaxID=2975399 RepID=UPI00244BA501|nr:DUF3455 domain-containing protein [Mitsuaria sp. GD03876]MDH0865876.1 DUF3455 domain-containing protein [Mitsuaria sp. GD03876]
MKRIHAALFPFLACAAVAASAQDLPATLRPAEGAQRLLELHAVGVQVYECARADGGGWTWQFRRPEATLTDARGAKAGDHGAGPFWQLNDGSRIVGQVQASSPAPAAGAIPWLLLTVKARSGAGGLEPVEAVQRVNTVGGVAPPAADCTGAASGTARVPYTADYVFWSAAQPR